MGIVADFVGGLIPTFIISRMLMWVMRSWNGGVSRLLLIHSISLLIISFIGAMGMADGGAFAGARAAALYAVPQIVWFLADLWRHRSGKSEVFGSR